MEGQTAPKDLPPPVKRRMRRRVVAALVGAGLLLVVAIVVFAVTLMTQTDWGRERIRRIALSSLSGAVNGVVNIGRVDGNLLRGIILSDVSITDSAGQPFVAIDTVKADYDPLMFLRKRIRLDDVELVRPVILLDQPPGGLWNYERIFPTDTAAPPSTEPGFGSWISLHDVTVRDGQMTARIPWEPPDTLTPAQQDSLIEFTLGPLGRANVVQVAGGYQNIFEFSELAGRFPLLQIADPDDSRMLIDVDSLASIAQPMRPPPVIVTDAKGRFILDGDSLYFDDVRVALAGSSLNGSGRYQLETGALAMTLHADRLSTDDLRWIDPNIPQGGTGTLDFAMDMADSLSDFRATKASLAVAGAKLDGDIGIRMSNTLALYDTDMRFAKLDTRTIAQLFPTLVSPIQGYLSGRMKADGPLERLALDGDVTFDNPRAGPSRVVAKGMVGTEGDVIRAGNLRVDIREAQVALAQAVDTAFPLDGIVRGTIVLDGATNTRLNITTDLTHSGTTGESRITGTTAYAAGNRPLLNADLRLEPLSLVTAGAFAPAAGLKGSIAGPVRLTGPMDSLILDVDLATPDGGAVIARGWADWQSAVKSYDVAVETQLFDASQVTTQSPQTSLTARATVRGSGITPDSINAVATLDMQASQYDSVLVDSAIVRLRAADGMAYADTVALDLPGTRATIAGTFGLVEHQQGTLEYDIIVDSLDAWSRFMPQDTSAVEPRPAILAERVRQAQEDSARLDKATEVQRAISGAPAPALVVDTPQVVRMNDLSGYAHTQGVLEGNIKQFSVRGSAIATSLVALGNTVDTLAAQYEWRNAMTDTSQLAAGLRADHVFAAGFELDSVLATVSHSLPLADRQSGVASVTVHQDTITNYRIDAHYTLADSVTTNEVTVDNMRLEFGPSTYQNTRPAHLTFGDAGTTIEDFELTSSAGGRVYVNGVLPATGDADVEIDVSQFDVASIMAAMQSTDSAQGTVSFNVRATGDVRNPALEGALAAQNIAYNSMPVPELRGTFEYANQGLQTGLIATDRDGAPILNAQGTVPINLALAGVTGSRIPQDREIDFRIDADSLPLYLIPDVTGVVTEMQGHAGAHFSVSGTLNQPRVDGTLALVDVGTTVIPTGVTYHSINGHIQFQTDTIIIDSLVATSRGVARLTGGIGLKKLSEPSFALRLGARDVQVLDNDDGSVRISASLRVNGPFNKVVAQGYVGVMEGVLYIPELMAPTKTVIGPGDPGVYQVVDTTLARNRELFPSESPLIANMVLKIGAFVERDFFVRSREMNVEVYSDDILMVTLDQAKNQIVLDGILVSDRGEYRFQGRRFQVKRGSATFVNIPEINPTLQVTAEYDVQFPSREAITISIQIGGTLEEPKITLASDAQPPISQTDLLSYLAFGRSSSSLMQMGGNGLTTGGSGSGNLVGQGAALATKQVSAAALGAVTEQVSTEVAKAIGADVLNISPADVSLDAGSFLRGTQIEFGKYVQRRTFLGLQFRPDPPSLKRPGFQLVHRFGEKGYRVETSFEPRYLPKQPSLAADQSPQTTSVFGLFLIREWRY